MSVCAGKHKAGRGSAPQGLSFPRYLCFSNSTILQALHKQSDLVRFLASSTCTRVQRYIIPHEFAVKKLLVRWSRTKEMKVYSVTSLLPVQAQRPALATSRKSAGTLQYLASLKKLDTCKVTKDRSVASDILRIVESVLGLLQGGLSATCEQLDECLLSLVRGADGVLYFIDSPLARVSPAQHTDSPPKSPLRSIVLPRLKSLSTMREGANYTVRGGSLMTERGGNAHRKSVEARIHRFSRTSEIAVAAEALDEMREKAKARKELSHFFQSLKCKEAKSGFLQNCVHQMYESVSADPKLSRFFPQNSETVHHIKTSVSQVFLEGKHISRIRDIHRNLGITEADFEVYVKHFGEVFEREGGSQHQVRLAEGFLRSFESQIVTKKHEKDSPSTL